MPTVTLYPSTITSVNYWSNANNAKVDDNTFAVTSGTVNVAHNLKGSGFDTSGIPAGSIINSVVLVAKYKLNAITSAWTGTLAAVKNGTEDTATAVTTTDEPMTATVWQNSSTGTYTLADLSTLAVLFRVLKTSVDACIYSVDYLAITVDYTVPYNYTGTITAAVGDDSILTGKKITLYAILDSLGQIAEISTSKGGLSDLAEAVGIDVVLSGNSLTVLRIYNPTKAAAVFDHTSQSKAVHDITEQLKTIFDITAIEEVKVDY